MPYFLWSPILASAPHACLAASPPAFASSHGSLPHLSQPLFLVLALRPDAQAAHAPARALTLVMILLALSPTAYPWYVIWAAALLPLAPSLGAALLAAGGAIYLLRFPNALTGAEPPFLMLGAQIALPLAVHLMMRRRAGA